MLGALGFSPRWLPKPMDSIFALTGHPTARHLLLLAMAKLTALAVYIKARNSDVSSG